MGDVGFYPRRWGLLSEVGDAWEHPPPIVIRLFWRPNAVA